LSRVTTSRTFSHCASSVLAFLQFIAGDDGLSPTFEAVYGGCGQSRFGSLLDEIAFELSESTEDVKDEALA